jgi:hypothetical protein
MHFASSFLENEAIIIIYSTVFYEELVFAE